MRNDTELFLHVANWLIETLEGGDSRHPADRGGFTRYGISQAAFPQLDIQALTRAQAVELYRQHYWLANACDQLPPPLAVLVFDGAVQHRAGVAAKLLQRALGVVADGRIGPLTIQAAQRCDLAEVMVRYLAGRADLYHGIVTADSSQLAFLRGWSTRLFRLQQFALGVFQPQGMPHYLNQAH